MKTTRKKNSSKTRLFTKTEANRVRSAIEAHFDMHMIEGTEGKCTPVCRRDALRDAINTIIEERNDNH